jgi:hypothetical protein
MPPQMREKEEVYLRGFLGRMLFSGEEALKSAKSVVWRRKSALHDFKNAFWKREFVDF